MHKIEMIKVGEENVNERLDKVLASQFSDKTRHYFQMLIEKGAVSVNGKLAKSSLKLKMNDVIKIIFPVLEELKLEAIKMPLDIVYEDKNVIVINKQAGMVVHPGEGLSHRRDSLVNAILYHCKGKLGGINGVIRPGIVHRLDKDTSGLLVVAKNDKAQKILSEQFKNRTVEKVYYALVTGHLEPEKGLIDAPIGRFSGDRKKMAVVSEINGRKAITKYKVIKYLGNYTYIMVGLITGRTHQIRVHFASIGYPLVGDTLYGRSSVNKKFEREYSLKRVFLHSGKLSIDLPGLKGTTKRKTFETALPKELSYVLKALEKENRF
jgi:23S rRNA pseudouridine1911/1915/1917 synthase